MVMMENTQNVNEIESKLLELISPEYLNSLIKLLRMVRKLDEMGVLDTLYDLLEPEVIEDFMNTFVTTNSTYLLSNVDDAMGLMAKIVDSFKEASNAIYEDNRPVITILNEMLTDEDTKRGIRFLSVLLKSLGKKLRS